jgi:outer membrane biosynthesis protein TonB
MIAVVLALLGLGALGMWLAMNMQEEGEEVADSDLPVPPDTVDPTEESVPDDEIEIGDMVPEGADPETSLITGTPRPRRSNDPAPNERTPTERAPTKRPATNAPSEGGSVPAPWTNEPSGERPSGNEQPASNQGSGNTNAEETRPNTIPPDEPDWEAMESEDPEMDAYSAQVRNVIRTYYMRRAQNCFDMATRNNASVRGTVVIGFNIQADGNIRNATVERNTTEIDTIGRCLATQVGGWRLPRPPGGSAPLAMQMPFS